MAALEAAAQDTSAQQTLGAPLPLRQTARERLFLTGASSSHLRQTLFAPRALIEDSRELGLSLGQLSVQNRHIAAEEASANGGEFTFHAAQKSGGIRLSAKRCELRVDLAFQEVGAFEIAPHLAQLELGALATALEGPQASGLLDLAPPVFRLAGQETLDLALTDDRVQLLAKADMGHQLDDIGKPAGRLVDEVVRRSVAGDSSHDAHFGRRQRQRAVGVVEGELYLGAAAGTPPVAAGEDHILHG